MVLTGWKKGELRTVVRTLLSDQAGHRVGGGVLDLLTEAVMDPVWMEILDRRPYFVSQLDTVTTLTSPGYINAASGGHLTKRLFRIQDIVRSSQSYAPLDPRHVMLEDNELQAANDRQSYVYIVLGPQIHLFPYETTPEVEVRYSYLPTKYTGLADSAVFEWPEGHELALALAVAAKVDRGLKDEADEQLGAMFSAVTRVQQGPVMPYHGVTAKAMGGE